VARLSHRRSGARSRSDAGDGQFFGPDEIIVLTRAYEDALRTLKLVDRITNRACTDAQDTAWPPLIHAFKLIANIITACCHRLARALEIDGQRARRGSGESCLANPCCRTFSKGACTAELSLQCIESGIERYEMFYPALHAFAAIDHNARFSY
jgi:hypothetical protein